MKNLDRITNITLTAPNGGAGVEGKADHLSGEKTGHWVCLTFKAPRASAYVRSATNDEDCFPRLPEVEEVFAHLSPEGAQDLGLALLLAGREAMAARKG